MLLDGKDIGLGKVVITDSKAKINNIEIPINCIDIYNKNHKYRFTFWTQREFCEYNKFPLNEKIDVMDLIDDYDIDFGSRELCTINTRDNSEVYFTRIGENKYIIDARINDMSEHALGGCMLNYKTLELEAVIDFIQDHE